MKCLVKVQRAQQVQRFGVDFGRPVTAQGGVSGAEDFAVGKIKGPLWVLFRFTGHAVVNGEEVVCVGQAS